MPRTLQFGRALLDGAERLKFAAQITFPCQTTLWELYRASCSDHVLSAKQSFTQSSHKASPTPPIIDTAHSQAAPFSSAPS